MRELSLFTGAGGGVLASELLGWRTVGYVEFNDYCQRVLAQRIEDGCIARAPIFGDIRAFVRDGYAESYQGMVDIVTGGFPCQPFSLAGKQKAEDDDRNMWPATLNVIRVVRPKHALLENVPGLASKRHGYLMRVIGDLAEAGYDCRWRILSAAELGAPHKRDRLWIYACDADSDSESASAEHDEASRVPSVATDADRRRSYSEQERKSRRECAPDAGRDGAQGTVADPCGPGLERHGRKYGLGETSRKRCSSGRSSHFPDAESIGQSRSGWPGNACNSAEETDWQVNRAFNDCQWPIEPDVGRVANGVAARMDRLKAIGNGQVPRVAAAAFYILSGEL